jgi:hypothetical protein
VRQFDTGATRDTDQGKLDFEGFLSPLALERYAEFMNKNRIQKDGQLRDSDNWQKGIPMEAYMKSGWRHFFDWWKLHRMSLDCPLTPEMEEVLEEALTAVLFNVQGYLHEHLKRKHGKWSWILLQEAAKESTDPAEDYLPDTRPVPEGGFLGDWEPPQSVVSGRNPGWWHEPIGG